MNTRANSSPVTLLSPLVFASAETKEHLIGARAAKGFERRGRKNDISILGRVEAPWPDQPSRLLAFL